MDDRVTDLARAAESGEGDAVRRLLAAGADPNEKSPGAAGMTPLMVAALHGNVWAVMMLAPVTDCLAVDDEGRTALHAAVWEGGAETVGLLSGLCDPDAAGSNGRTALMMAAEGNLDEAGVLALAGISNLSKRTPEGLSAEDFARLAGRTGLAGLLGAMEAERELSGIAAAPLRGRPAGGL